jgi:hypothetical protein
MDFILVVGLLVLGALMLFVWLKIDEARQRKQQHH